jgi:hypothetical protein
MMIDGVMPKWQVVLEMRVDDGVEFLDEVEPGWFNRINPEYLYMSSSSSCVCGQVFNEMWQEEENGHREADTGWEYFKDQFGVDGEELGFDSFYLCECGTADPDEECDNHTAINYTQQYSYLAEAWIRRVEKKLANQG